MTVLTPSASDESETGNGRSTGSGLRQNFESAVEPTGFRDSARGGRSARGNPRDSYQCETPVTVHLIDAALGKLHAGEIELRGLAGQFAQTLGQRGRRVIEVDEDEVEPFLKANRGEAEILGIEIFHAIEFGSDE